MAAFAPREDEIALAADWGPTRYHDTLHDRASYRYYWSVLRRADAAGRALPAEVAPWLPPRDEARA